MHTMATPELTPTAAIAFAAELGCGGIELVIQDLYRCGLPSACTIDKASELGTYARDLGAPVIAVTPYDRAFNAADQSRREAAIKGMIHAIRLGKALGAASVRVLAGDAVDGADWNPAFDRLVAALRQLAAVAASEEIGLNIENHDGTMADSAARTMAIWSAVGHASVGVIYDPVNLERLGRESYPQSLALQRQAIRHLHLKDDVIAADGTRRACVPGRGNVPWPAMIEDLQRHGYAGDATVEYERRWLPDILPPASESLPEAIGFIERCRASPALR